MQQIWRPDLLESCYDAAEGDDVWTLSGFRLLQGLEGVWVDERV